MKKLSLLIAILFVLMGCANEPDYYSGRESFMREVAPYQGTRIMHISDVHGDFKRLGVILDIAAGCADLVINTGDDANGRQGQSFKNIANDFARYRIQVERCPLPVLGVQGNHDAFCTRREYRDAMFAYNPDVVAGDDLGAYGYYDTDDLRIILLDPRDAPEPLDWWSATFSQKQLHWLVATLDDACSRGLGVITVMHYGFGDNKQFNHENMRPDINFLEDPFRIPAIIDSMRTNCGLDYIAHLSGHLHSKEAYRCAKADGSRDYNILMLTEASLSRAGNALDETVRNGDDDIAASLLIIDRNHRIINRISYGAYLPPRCQSFTY